MNTKKVILLTLFLLFFGTVSVASAARLTDGQATDDNRYFVKTNSSFWKKSLGVRHQFDDGFTTNLSDFQLKLARAFKVDIEPVKKLNILPGEISAVSPKKTPAPKSPSDQTPWGIETIYNDPTLSATSGGAGVNVAILDTGIYRTHPDLKNRVKACRDFSTNTDPIVENKCDDKNGHGTHVAGIVAADGGPEAKGIYGVAPEASLLIYKVCSNSGTCYSDDVAAAIRQAVDNNANIINLSLGSDSPSSLITNAAAYAVAKNVLVVAAAGNDGPYPGSLDYPAADPNVVAVGAVDYLLNIPDWSARGLNSLTTPDLIEEGDIELAAPGVNIESTWKDGGYAFLSGTSMASPHVAGLAAKLWSSDVLNQAATVRDLLHKLSKDLLPLGDDDASGSGLPQLK